MELQKHRPGHAYDHHLTGWTMKSNRTWADQIEAFSTRISQSAGSTRGFIAFSVCRHGLGRYRGRRFITRTRGN
jgi:hypothetical protein